VGRRRGAGAEGREDLVDHRRLRDARHDPHGAVAGRTCGGIDLEDLLEQRRPAAAASVGAIRGAETVASGPSAAAGSAFPRMPRGRLAYQP